MGFPLKTTRRAWRWLVFALLLFAAGISYTAWSYHQIDVTSDKRRTSRSVIGLADDLISNLKDAESGQRGYLLTGDPAYLAPYRAVRDGVMAQLADLRRSTTSSRGTATLDLVEPLIIAKMAELAQLIELRGADDQNAVRLQLQAGEGKRLMDEIRVGMGNYLAVQQQGMAQHDADFDDSMRRLLGLMVGFGVLTLLFSGAFAYLLTLRSRQRVKDLVHLETRHLLAAQEDTNRQLEQTNRRLQDGERKLSVTLNSIGDAVIATDAQARVTLLNPVAQLLTGWTQAEAVDQPIDKVFHIVNTETREPASTPVAQTLARGTLQGLANHTTLVARDGREFDIADSCAPIRDSDGQVVGAVLVFRNVTEEYAAQASLRDSAALVQTIFNTVVDGIVTIHAQGGIIEAVNPAIELMFGYTAADLGGKPLSLLIPELDQEQHNVSLDYYSASAEARALGVSREVMGRRKDGSAFPLEIAVSDMLLGGQRYFTGILRDISTRKQAQEAALKDGALQKAIFDSANFFTIATDAKGVIQIFNVGAERMLGYTAAEVMNQRNPADLSDPQEVMALAKALSLELDSEIAPGFESLAFKASRGMEDIYELTYIRKDGSRLPTVVSVRALRDEADAIIGYLLIGTDNTARKAVEAERERLGQVLRDKNTELEDARANADKANLAKSEFLSAMSHELRSPLNAILGFAQLMESGDPLPTPGQKASVDQILRAGWYLLELINEVLDLSLIESGRMSLSREPVSLPEVLQDCQKLMTPLALKKDIDLHFPQLFAPCFVDADKTRLKQVVINLLSNAVKYNVIGGSVDITCTIRAQQRLRISVQDTGMGLAPEQIAHLYQPFNRLGKEDSGEEGTGIGLVVSKRLVEQMGGAMGVVSAVGAGSLFWIELDLVPAPQLGWAETEPAPMSPAGSDDGARVRTLLYVEDNRANMQLVEQLIARRPDMQLYGAEDAMRGIALARDHQPEIILLDINLPGISGLQALKILRDDQTTKHIPVLALSANAMPRDIEKGLAAGFFRYLTKPIRVPDFMEALDTGLALAEEQRQAGAGRGPFDGR
jgi:PAS domain S-box-containing protein